jgi:hypothetical protein
MVNIHNNRDGVKIKYALLIITLYGYTYKGMPASGYAQPDYSLPHCLNGICEAGEGELEVGAPPTCS